MTTEEQLFSSKFSADLGALLSFPAITKHPRSTQMRGEGLHSRGRTGCEQSRKEGRDQVKGLIPMRLGEKGLSDLGVLWPY